MAAFDSPHLSMKLFLCLVFILSSFVCVLSVDFTCIEVKKSYVEKGFSEGDAIIQAVSGHNLEICNQGKTCCTKDMEDQLHSLSTKEYKRALEDAFKSLKVTFKSKTRKFDEFFSELLENARNDLNEMFVKTYGLLYRQHSDVFMNLFTELKNYYKGKNIPINDTLNGFFTTLLKKMFELLNQQYTFTAEYMNCVAERMDHIQPFGDVPRKLSVQVRRAFIAARTFVQGLAIGRDVIVHVSEMPVSAACSRALMKMRYCPHCRGLTSTKPCNNFCLNTLKGCLAYHAELNSVWNEYVDALKMLAKRLEGPFNIESVVDPLDVKISNAIMNMQEKSTDVTNSAFSECGNPSMGRKKRDAQPGNVPYDALNFRPRPPSARPTTAAGTSLDRLVRDIKDKVKHAKDFWISLPHIICNNSEIAAQHTEDTDCWNGQDRARYLPEVLKDGVSENVNNPEVEVDMRKSNSLINRQVLQLKIITGKLQNAYNGLDVEWMDTEIDVEFASGSGAFLSGDGSGSGGGSLPDGSLPDIGPPYDSNSGIVIDNDKPDGPDRPGDKDGQRPGPSTPRTTTEAGASALTVSYGVLLCSVLFIMLRKVL